MSTHLLSLATAVPPYRLDQTDVVTRVRHLFGDRAADVERLLPVFGNAGIDARYSCVPIDWYNDAHGWSDRNRLYLDSALDLLHQATDRALDRAGVAVEEIGTIVSVSTTGIATPSLEARLMERMGMRRDVRRLPIFGLGCAGGVLGLARAAALTEPDRKTLFLVTELCALAFRKDDFSKSNIVATALFGDGAAAAVLGRDGAGPRLGAAGEYTWPDSLGVMGWDVADDGLKAIFSRDIPNLVTTDLGAIARQFLAGHGLLPRDIDTFVCHPGGAKVLDALETAYGLPDGALAVARQVLRDYGNMSAATVMFVLERLLARGPLGRAMMSAMGPGFTAGFLMLEPA